MIENDILLKYINEHMYDFEFKVNKEQFKLYLKAKFRGNYLVDWGKGKITKERI